MGFADNKSNSDEVTSKWSEGSAMNEQNFSNQENIDWCKSSHCAVMPTYIDCKCCK